MRPLQEARVVARTHVWHHQPAVKDFGRARHMTLILKIKRRIGVHLQLRHIHRLLEHLRSLGPLNLNLWTLTSLQKLILLKVSIGGKIFSHRLNRIRLRIINASLILSLRSQWLGIEQQWVRSQLIPALFRRFLLLLPFCQNGRQLLLQSYL